MIYPVILKIKTTSFNWTLPGGNNLYLISTSDTERFFKGLTSWIHSRVLSGSPSLSWQGESWLSPAPASGACSLAPTFYNKNVF
jgi:hypothetical protein